VLEFDTQIRCPNRDSYPIPKSQEFTYSNSALYIEENCMKLAPPLSHTSANAERGITSYRVVYPLQHLDEFFFGTAHTYWLNDGAVLASEGPGNRIIWKDQWKITSPRRQKDRRSVREGTPRIKPQKITLGIKGTYKYLSKSPLQEASPFSLWTSSCEGL
jgi:hypothetical protein